MNKTNFSEKCNIIGDLWLYYQGEAQANELWADFFAYNDLALPMAHMIANDLVIVSGDGRAEEFIDETWNMFCEYINIDPDGWYKDLVEAFEASPNKPLGESNEG